MSKICLIPARGGSKRIPRKNIKLFHGKPLIAWSIESAIRSDIFDQIYVSTDDNEIANIAKKYGAKIPFLRPSNLSDDYSNDKDVRNHFLKWLNEKNLNCKYLCYLYPTAPFISKKTFASCFDLLIKSECYSVKTITKFNYPVQRALKKDNEDNLTYMWEEFKNHRSQDLNELFHDAGQCYFFNLQKNEEKGVLGYELSRFECQDIDTIEDFKFAEFLFDYSRKINLL